MERLRWALLITTVLIITTAPCSSQSRDKSARPDLRKYSSDQLKACFDDAKVCGSDNVYDISDELAHRLPKLPSEQLVACFDDWKICGAGEGQASGWPISDELARRGDPHELLVRYWTEPKWTVRDGIEHVAYHFDNHEVTSFMKRVFAERVEDGEDLYWPANYLAKKCDPSALKELSTGRYRGQGCMQYETSVKLFGKCKYQPAIPYLAKTAIHDACLNIVEAADHSLHALYPDAPKDFDRLDEMQAYFCSRAHQEGFDMHCDSK
jgi:hypothetical protein